MTHRDPESVYRSTPETPLFDKPKAQGRDYPSWGSGLSLKKARARKTDRATSHEAAKSVRGITETQKAIIAILGKFGPLTDEQIHRVCAIRVSPSGLRSRRSELCKSGDVEACGEGRAASGRKCTIWRLKEAK